MRPNVPESIDAETRKKANDTVRSWGEKTNKVPQKALGGQFGENDTVDKVISVVLGSMPGIDAERLKDTDFRQQIIDANPSVFDKDGTVYADADIKRLDFPTAAAINHIFLGGPAPAKPEPKVEIAQDQATKMVTDSEVYKEIEAFLSNLKDTTISAPFTKESIEKAKAKDIAETQEKDELSLTNLAEYKKLVDGYKEVDPKTIGYKATMDVKIVESNVNSPNPMRVLNILKEKTYTYSVSFTNIQGGKISASFTRNSSNLGPSEDRIKTEALKDIKEQLKSQGYKYVEVK